MEVKKYVIAVLMFSGNAFGGSLSEVSCDTGSIQEQAFCKITKTYFSHFFSFNKQLLIEYDNAKKDFYEEFGLNQCFGDSAPCGPLSGVTWDTNPFVQAPNPQCEQCLVNNVQPQCSIATDMKTILLPTEIKHIVLPLCYPTDQCPASQYTNSPYLFGCAYGQSLLKQTNFYTAVDSAYDAYMQAASQHLTDVIEYDIIPLYAANLQANLVALSNGQITLQSSSTMLSSFFKNTFGTTLTTSLLSAFTGMQFSYQGANTPNQSFDCSAYLGGGNYTYWFKVIPNALGFYTGPTGCVVATSQHSNDTSTTLDKNDRALKVCGAIPECSGVFFTNDQAWQTNQANITASDGTQLKAAVLFSGNPTLQASSGPQTWYTYQL